ncbi:MAG: Methylthioribose-phosphate isomerase [Planctomycetota bacterium]
MICLSTAESVWEAIKVLRVRGAPAIGCAAAFGAVIGARSGNRDDIQSLRTSLISACDYLATSRPTAVNLFWALDRMKRVAGGFSGEDTGDFLNFLLNEAQTIRNEDDTMCHAIGRHGSSLISDGTGILTHCNAGGLATSDYGTALAVIYSAHEAGKNIQVYADETRPLLQGSRLTAWELSKRGVPVTVICDNMAAVVMRERKVQAVVVGADRIAANGDSANKIGTYGVALLARAHGIPFYIAAPSSTFDMSLPNGDGIPIEERAAEEITQAFGRITAPEGVKVYNPAFDVTPAELITALITEKGIISPVTTDHIRSVIG